MNSKKIIPAPYRATLAAGFLACSFTPLWAADVVITANRFEQPITQTLAAITVLTEEDIDRYQDQDLVSLLNRVAGLSIKTSGTRGSVATVFLRGSNSKQLLVLVDGLRSSSASTGQTSFASIPLGQIKRIEIVRGAQSVQYGADGIGGVIQIFTKDPKSAENELFVETEYGSYNSARLGAGWQFSNATSSVAAHVQFEQSDGFDSTSLQDGPNQDNDGLRQWTGSVNAGHQFTPDLGLAVVHSQSRSEVGIDSSCLWADCTTDEPFETQTDLSHSNLTLDYQALANLKLQSSLGRFVDHSITDAYDSDIKSERYQLAIQALSQPTSRLTTVIGVDAHQEKIDSTTDYGETERQNLAAFAHAQHSLGRFNLQGGIRFDDNSVYGGHWTGSLAASAFVSDSLEVIGTASTAFRAPAFNELYFPFSGNADLRPETAQSVELSLRQFVDNGEWRLSIYQNRIDDLIVSDPVTWIPYNVNEARLTGVELEWSQRFGIHHITANLGYLEALDGEDQRLDHRPEWTGFVGAETQLGYVSVQTDLQLETGRLNGGELMDDQALVGVGTRYYFNTRSYLAARVDNLLNQDYVQTKEFGYDYYTAGRNFRLTLKYFL